MPKCKLMKLVHNRVPAEKFFLVLSDNITVMIKINFKVDCGHIGILCLDKSLSVTTALAARLCYTVRGENAKQS